MHALELLDETGGRALYTGVAYTKVDRIAARSIEPWDGANFSFRVSRLSGSVPAPRGSGDGAG